MANIVSIFNNKGGVGKTTYLFHVAHLLARRSIRTIMVDCDAQCNLTAYALQDDAIETSWGEEGNSIYRAIELVYRGIGDIRTELMPTQLAENLWIVPGDVGISNYEDLLGDTWSSAKGGSEPALRAQSAIYRYINTIATVLEAQLVFLDLGPNLGALNRAVLGSSDFFIVPVSPDLFSIRGTGNLGEKLVLWHREWVQCQGAWNGGGLPLPAGSPSFLGYVVQQHNIRNRSSEGMTRGWRIFGDRLTSAIQENIVEQLRPLGQIHNPESGEFLLGRIPNLHSLIPYSLEARKPVYDCRSSDGLTGAHIQTAADSANHFEDIVDMLETLCRPPLEIAQES